MAKEIFYISVGLSICVIFLIFLLSLGKVVFSYLRTRKEKSIEKELIHYQDKIPAISDIDRDWIVEILLYVQLSNLLLFFQNAAFFEKTVKKYKRKRSTIEANIKQLPYLRDIIGFSSRNSFFTPTLSRQLHFGLKLEGKVIVEGQCLSFQTAILANYEQELWMDSSEIQSAGSFESGQPFTFTFTVQRDQQNLFQFTSNLVYQVSTPYPSLILEHTDKVNQATNTQKGNKKIKRSTVKRKEIKTKTG